jgi:integral membrane protein
MSAKVHVVAGALTRFRVMAWLTGGFLIVMTAALVAKYVFAAPPGWYGIGWQIHGFLYAVYLLAVLDIAVRARWQPLRIVLIALAGTIPAVGLWAERVISREMS